MYDLHCHLILLSNTSPIIIINIIVTIIAVIITNIDYHCYKYNNNMQSLILWL